MNQPFFPDYRHSILNLSCSILKHFNVPVQHETLPEADRILSENFRHTVVILLDGLGVNILEKHLSPDSFLRRCMITEYSSIFPPTTTASTTSMLSGLSPVEHGWLGWDVYFSQEDKTVTCFTNNFMGTKTQAAPYSLAYKYFPYESIHTLINKANPDDSVHADLVFPFGPKPFPELDDWLAEIKRQCSSDKRTFTYAYWENPDHDLHVYGTENEIVHKTVNELNDRIEKLCTELKDTVVFVTADHGHTDIYNEYLEDDYPELAKMFVRTPSIEPRALSFFIKDEYLKPADVNSDKSIFACEFEKLFGNDYVLFSRKEVFEKQLFGPGNPHINLTGIGDYIAAGTGKRCLNPSMKASDHVFKSHHAGLTPEEIKIPLICLQCTVN